MFLLDNDGGDMKTDFSRGKVISLPQILLKYPHMVNILIRVFHECILNYK